jgi:hypothetical protein
MLPLIIPRTDHEMSDLSSTYDSDPGAPLNDDSMEVDVDILLLAKRYDEFMLFDLVKHSNMQLASKYHEDVLGVFVARFSFICISAEALLYYYYACCIRTQITYIYLLPRIR